MARNQDTWAPKFPDFALDREGTVGAPIHDPDVQSGGGSVEWVTPPPDSHLHSFRFHDARRIAFLRKFRGNVSILTVRFKPPKGQPHKGISEYEYEFADHAQGERVFQQMQTMAHPGEMIQELIRLKIPYRPTHK